MVGKKWKIKIKKDGMDEDENEKKTNCGYEWVQIYY